MPRKYKPLIERFWSKVDQSAGPDGCWIWTAGRTSTGYGGFNLSAKDGEKRAVKAHRFAYELQHGSVHNGLNVLHRCDVPLCVNPNHLFLGTQKDNMLDMDLKGRRARGERLPHTKLTDEAVTQIRAAHGSQASIARQFRICQQHVSDIRNGDRRSVIKSENALCQSSQ